jgi:hypothetical protein
VLRVRRRRAVTADQQHADQGGQRNQDQGGAGDANSTAGAMARRWAPSAGAVHYPSPIAAHPCRALRRHRWCSFGGPFGLLNTSGPNGASPGWAA